MFTLLCLQRLCVSHNPSNSDVNYRIFNVRTRSSNACVYTRGQCVPEASQHIIFDSDKPKFLSRLGGYWTLDLWISGPVRCPLSLPAIPGNYVATSGVRSDVVCCVMIRITVDECNPDMGISSSLSHPHCCDVSEMAMTCSYDGVSSFWLEHCRWMPRFGDDCPFTSTGKPT